MMIFIYLHSLQKKIEDALENEVLHIYTRGWRTGLVPRSFCLTLSEPLAINLKSPICG